MIDIQKMIQPHFKQMWTTPRPYVILRGGRNSFKSSTISMKLVEMFLYHVTQNHPANIECFAKTQDGVYKSVYGQIVQAMSWFGVTDWFDFYRSPMHIKFKYSDSNFWFYGIDKPEKLKSNTDPNVIALWYEELANFANKDDVENNNVTFLRHKSEYVDEVKVFYSYNPPRDQYAWVNEWTTSKLDDPDYFIDTSTYLDDKLGLITSQIMKDIERKKKFDNDYYRWQYLGEPIGLGTSIYSFSLFQQVNSIPFDETPVSLYFGLDSGAQHSATAEVAVVLTDKDKLYVYDTYYYSPIDKPQKKAPSDLAKDINDFENRIQDELQMDARKFTSDSASVDFALENQMFKDFGVKHHHLAKPKKFQMISNVQDILAQGRVFVRKTANNKIFLREHRQYQWDDKTLESDKPEPIKVFDHSVDAFMYIIQDSKRDFNLQF